MSFFKTLTYEMNSKSFSSEISFNSSLIFKCFLQHCSLPITAINIIVVCYQTPVWTLRAHMLRLLPCCFLRGKPDRFHKRPISNHHLVNERALEEWFMAAVCRVSLFYFLCHSRVQGLIDWCTQRLHVMENNKNLTSAKNCLLTDTDNVAQEFVAFGPSFVEAGLYCRWH